MGGAACSLCESDGGRLVVRTPQLRVIHAAEAGFPGFYRVVWNDHKAELSDLGAPERIACLDAVVVVEEALRRHLQPTKVNIAALGNMVAHLHWHVIARYEWDSHFPSPVWAAAVRTPEAAQMARVQAQLPAAEAQMVQRLGA
jgi:diadenosine tetraphosphate (Ap4A) HIT family hydrolase